MNKMNLQLDRRQVLKAGAAGAGSLLLATGLAGCAGQNATEKINEANAELIGSLDLEETRLPLGSVVELSLGRYMVIGQRAIQTNEGASKCTIYDYYGIGWPEGCMAEGSEPAFSVHFNITDIKQVLFLGLVNDEDRDFREYMQQWDCSSLAIPHENGTEAGYAYNLGYGRAEQSYRLEGKLSEELYGEHGNEFQGGLCYTSSTSE